MRLATFVSISFLTFASLGLASQAPDGGKGGERKSVYAELEKVPEKYRARQNPLARDPEAVAAGQVLFEEHCQECHGKEALGGKKAPNLRVTEVQQAAPGVLFYILSNGVVRKGMPVWSKLPEPQRWQLVSYVKSLGVGETRSDAAKTP
jgi:mono/diheme cytochrome c family protein